MILATPYIIVVVPMALLMPKVAVDTEPMGCEKCKSIVVGVILAVGREGATQLRPNVQCGVILMSIPTINHNYNTCDRSSKFDGL